LNSCKQASDCSADCPESYSPACVNDSCVCQKTTIVPYSCQTINDCSKVSCPATYEKGCRENVCVCAHGELR
jgi:hypothetical protein